MRNLDIGEIDHRRLENRQNRLRQTKGGVTFGTFPAPVMQETDQAVRKALVIG
jgi:hypothetical protein